ncbi:TetR/AcrR family transcriptional regulator [Undibacterium parvum]|uniref:TetR/AcrR family transcriptional regulator n=1 Tax=Undibacterium parvum TaxID=401471 RepID=A0A3Q9BS96_9BURK|nr:TetR/AcrR family transcriptional regulator [Undibacterium parvum]AZP13346.1 TetR/AcrR family transcriptional regulator [Undibacterium parvum]
MNTPRTNVRQHILDTAKPIILGKGFSVVGLNEVLSAAAVPKGSFYHYFKSKELFGEALLESYFSDYLEYLDKLLNNQALPAAERLMSYWRGWLESQASCDMQGKCLAVKLGGEVSDLSEAMRLALHQGTDQIIDRLAVCIDAAMADGSLSGKIDAHHTAQTLYEMWLGATLLSKMRRDRSAMDGAMLATLSLLNLAK